MATERLRLSVADCVGRRAFLVFVFSHGNRYLCGNKKHIIMANTPDICFDPNNENPLDDIVLQEAVRHTIEYIEWRNSVLGPIERYRAMFFTPWVPYVPVVLEYAPKHIKYRWKRRKKRIIKKWYHRSERETRIRVKREQWRKHICRNDLIYEASMPLNPFLKRAFQSN